tara:strand:- start:314 stop:1996 length:1683 start_codon:yes stop_codon:yes gene_type:complete
MISVSGKEWKEYKIPKRLIDKYSSDFDVSENLSKFYLTRNFNKEDIFIKNINNNLNIFSDSKDFLLGTKMIINIIKNKKKTLIFGDYDVDGISSITILSSYFKHLKHPFKYVIPDRFIDGYGPNVGLLEKNLDKEIDNIIFLDCGSNSHNVIDYLKTKKIKSIIVDHHIINNLDVPKSDVLINPTKNNHKITKNNVCTATLTFFLVDLINKQLNSKFQLYDYFIFSLISTICDLMPLRGFNRKILTIGFKNPVIKNKGLKKLINNNLKKKLSYKDIGFNIGPLINSSGRIAKANDVVELFLSQNDDKIKKIIDRMISHNELRKRVEQANLNLINFKKYYGKNVVFIYNKKFHEGTIGIIAAKLSQLFNRPCFILTESNGLLKCSIRSGNKVRINKTINRLISKQLIISGGGHDEAGGFTAKKEYLLNIEDFLKKEYENLNTKNYSYFDSYTVFPKKNSTIINDLKSLEPFGKGNPEPIFYFKNIKSIKSKIINNRHVQNILKNKSGRSLKSISFDCVNSELGKYLLNFKKEFDLIGCIIESSWNNRKELELIVLDIIPKT